MSSIQTFLQVKPENVPDEMLEKPKMQAFLFCFQFTCARQLRQPECPFSGTGDFIHEVNVSTGTTPYKPQQHCTNIGLALLWCPTVPPQEVARLIFLVPARSWLLT